MSQSHRPPRRALRRAAIAALPIALLTGEVPAFAAPGKGQPSLTTAERPPKPGGIAPAPQEEPPEAAPAPAADAGPQPIQAPPPAAEAGPPPGQAGPGSPVPPQGQAAQSTPDEDGEAAEEPPARVGRLARIQGNVGFRPSAEEDWTPAQANTPLVAGNAIYTAPGARAALQVNQIRIALDGGSDFQFARLDDGGTVATLPRGSIYLEAQGLLEQETIEIVTPGGSLVITGGGRYVVEAGQPAEAPGGFRAARFTVLDGEARFVAQTLEQSLGPGQALVFEGDSPVLARATAAMPLIAWATALSAKAPTPTVARQMTGAEDLGLYGRWDRSPDHGDVWYPEVAASWVPYRQGRWVWREPWGWTWLDDQPWGFAPFHYGRWVQIGPRWAWAPQPERVVVVEEAWRPRRPIWAPALVAFVDGVALGPRGPGVAWVPLGPREPYYPWFRASPRYVRGVNFFAVRDPRDPERRWREYRREWAGPRPGFGGPPGPRPGFGPPPRAFEGPFANRVALTAVPAPDMTGSRPLRGVSQAGVVMPPGFGRRPGGPAGAPALAAPPPPSGQTLGVTPAVAGRIGLPPGSAMARPRRDGPPPQTHVPLTAGRPGFGPQGPAGRAGPGPGGAPQAAPSPQSGPPQPGPGAPPQGGSPQAGGPGGPGLGAAGAAAAGAAAGLGAAGLMGRQGTPPQQGVAPGGRPGLFAPAPGVRLQPGAPVPQQQHPGQAGQPGVAPGQQVPGRPGGFAPGAAPSQPGAAPTPGSFGRPGQSPGGPNASLPSQPDPGRQGFVPGQRPGTGPATPGAVQTPRAPDRPGFEPGQRPGFGAATPGAVPTPQAPNRPGFEPGQRPGFGTTTPGAVPAPQAPNRPGFEPGQRPRFGATTPGAVPAPQTPSRPGFEPGQRPGFGTTTPGAVPAPQAPNRPGFEPGQRPGFGATRPGAMPTPQAPSRPGFEPGQRPGFGGAAPGGQGFRQPAPQPQPQRPVAPAAPPITRPSPPPPPAPVARPSPPPAPAARPSPPPAAHSSPPPRASAPPPQNQRPQQRPADQR